MMLTGDSLANAISCAYSCNLFKKTYKLKTISTRDINLIRAKLNKLYPKRYKDLKVTIEPYDKYEVRK